MKREVASKAIVLAISISLGSIAGIVTAMFHNPFNAILWVGIITFLFASIMGLGIAIWVSDNANRSINIKEGK